MGINANSFIAPTLNPEYLPLPDAIEVVDQEVIFAERMAEFQRRADQVGFPYDVGGLEFDPIVIDQQAHAHREALMRARVNSAVRAVLPAYAQGADLDAIVARANVQRLVITPADPETGALAVMESDQNLLIRYLTSFAVPSAGSRDGYVYHTLTAYPTARDVHPVGPEVHQRPGRVVIYLLGPADDLVTPETVQIVRERVMRPNVKPLTDEVIVSAATIIPYEVELNIRVPRGPAPAMVAEAARTAVMRAAAARFAIGAHVHVNALEGAAYVANVLRVHRVGPAGDIVAGPGEAPLCTDVKINVEVET